jgi:hypothetical protein
VYYGAVGEINPTTGVITQYEVPLSGGSSALGIALGPDGNLWFTGAATGTMATINPTTHAFTYYSTPYPSSEFGYMAAGPDGNVWFTDSTTDSIGVVPVKPAGLAITQQPPSTVTAGAPFSLAVEAEDSSGNLDPYFDGTMTVALASNPGGDTLGGTLTVTAAKGVATFSGLTLTRAAAGYTLQVSVGGINPVTTNAITVTPAAASQVVITQQPPSSVVVNTGFGLVAAIEDAYGNVVASATNKVTVALASNPTGASLGGTTSVTASQGIATFSGLTINKVGSGYTLQLTSKGLASATTSAITVTSSATMSLPPSTTAGAGTPSLLPVAGLVPQALDSPDFFDTLLPGRKRR